MPSITKQNCKIFHQMYSNSQPLNSDELGVFLISSPNTESCPSIFLVFEGSQNAIGTMKTSGIWHYYTWRWRCNSVHSVHYPTDAKREVLQHFNIKVTSLQTDHLRYRMTDKWRYSWSENETWLLPPGAEVFMVQRNTVYWGWLMSTL